MFERVCKVSAISVLLFFYFNCSFAQPTKTLRGVVLDELSGEPVSFATVFIKEQGKGTTTGGSGLFEVDIDAGEEVVITVSHINYDTKGIIVNDSLLRMDIKIYLISREVQLSDVVISASLYEQPMEKLTTPASLITIGEIIDNMNSNIVDMLSKTPGFTQVWEYHSPIILRGLNSNRLIIMKDENRRIGTFPGGYFGQDLNIYDTKKVEIIKGPGSVIYGSGAISGIINIISEEPFGKDENSVGLHSGYGSNNNEFMEMVKLSHKKEKSGISLNGKYRKTGDMVYGDGEVAENSDVEDRDITLNTGYKFSNEHKILLNASYHYGEWGKPRGFNGTTKRFTKIRNEEENVHTDFSYTYSPKGFVESVNLNLYYDDGWRDYYQYKYSTVSDDLSTLDLVHYKDHYGGGRLYAILNLSGNNKLSTGVDGYLFRLDNPSDIIDYYNATEGQTEGYKNAGQQNFGVFINDEYQLTAKIRLVAGVRLDAATVVEGENPSSSGREEKRDAFSGNAGLVYSPSGNTHISLNVGRAFRMPTTEELFTKVVSCKGIKVGNPELLPEYSWNYDLGIRGYAFNRKLKYDLAAFYNMLEDFINEAPVDDPDIDFTYKNSDAELMGGELSASYSFDNIFKPANTLYAGLGAAYVYGSDLSDEGKSPLFGIPPFKINAELNYRGNVDKRWITGYNLKLDTEIAAAQNRVASVPEGTEGGPWGYVPSDPHAVFNFSLDVNADDIIGSPAMRFIVNNILDVDYKPFGSYIPAMGRNFKILLSVHF